MKQVKTIGLALCCALSSLSLHKGHEFYVSVGEMTRNTESRRLEIALRVFSDDLEYALERMGHPGVDIINDKDSATLRFIEQYLAGQFSIRMLEKPLNLNLLGVESDADVSWLFLESTPVTSSGKMNLKHTVLMDVYPAQVNILHFKHNNRRKSYYFTETKSTQSIEW